MDVGDFLRKLGLQQYEAAFRDNRVDVRVLPKLTAEDLKDLGVTMVGDRRLLLEAIAALREPTAPAVKADAEALDAAPVRRTQAASTAEAERRQVTVMFCDLVGSTALSARLDPEDLREVIGHYQACVAETVARFDGFVAKYMGDGVLVYFGYPHAHEDDAEQAVRAALALIDAVGGLQAPAQSRLRVGIATGLVVVGDLVGTGSAQEQAIVGETPNLAARLQALAEPNTVVIAESTRRQIGTRFETEEFAPQSLKGFAEPQRAWRVLSENRALGRFEALRSGATPLIGRDEELELLLRRWAQAKAGNGRVVLISAEPGVGKSRLAEALAEQIAAEPHVQLRYFCSPHHQDSTLYPIIAQMERAAAFERDDALEVKLGKLQSLLAAESIEDVALIAALHSLSSADLSEPCNDTPQRKKEKTLKALLHHIERLSQEQPVLLVFEDLHWIDPSSRELLERMIAQLEHWPMLLLVTLRPEFQAPWIGLPHVTMLTLARLGRRDTAALVAGVAGSQALPPATVEEIVERADGIPLFVEELTKAVLEAGAQGATPTFSVPPTLHASLMARLDRLGAAARDVAQTGAAIGREFGQELLASTSDLPELQLREALDLLTNSGLLFARGTTPKTSYIFKHALVQDAAYSTLVRSRRQALHARIGRVLEEHFPEVVETQPEILAHHFTRAGLVEPAIELWRRAGARSLDRSAHSEAAAHFACVLDLVQMLPANQQHDERELEFTLALAVPLIAVHGFGSLRVEQCALRAKELSDKLRGSPRRFAAQRVAWNSCLMRQPVWKTVALARDLVVGLADEDRSLAKLAIAQRSLGYSLYIAGELREGSEILERGIALADGVSDHEFAVYGEHPGMVCRAYVGQAKILMGFPETGGKLIQEAIAHARREKNAHSLAWALAVAAQAFMTLHEPHAVVRFAAEVIDMAREHRLPQWLALAERCKGWAMHQLGELAAGLDLQQSGVRRWYETGATLHTTHCEVYLAESFLREGQTAPARAHLAHARAHRTSHGEDYLAAEIDRLEALTLQIEEASAETVEQYLANSLSTARRQGARLLELRAATSLARVLASNDERQKAVDLLAPIYNWFTEGFDAPDLIEAKALLHEL